MKTNFKKLRMILVLTLGSTLFGYAQRVVGYIPCTSAATGLSTVQWNDLTDVYVGSVNPNTSGHLMLTTATDDFATFDPAFFQQVNAAYQVTSPRQRKLWISVGGADTTGNIGKRLSSISGDPYYNAVFANELIHFALTNHLEGINIDWRYPVTAINKSCQEKLLVYLRAQIKQHGYALKLSAVVGGEYKGSVNSLQNITQTSLDQLDFVDVRAMDLPASSYGPDPSTFADATNAMLAWSYGANSLPVAAKTKLCMGIPLYGRNSTGQNVAYNSVVDSDYITAFYSGLNVGYYYNSYNTVKSKVDWVKQNGYAGIVLWDVLSDRANPYSYQNIITQALQPVTFTAPRVAAYVAGWNLYDSGTLNTGQWSCLTDIYYGSVNPLENGHLFLLSNGQVGSFDIESFTAVKNRCQPVNSAGPRLWISVGGAGSGVNSRLNSACSAAATRAIFIKELLDFAHTNELTGISLNWQYPANATEGANYSSLVRDLRTAINALHYDIKLSITLKGDYKYPFSMMAYTSQTMLDAVDYIDVAAYDFPVAYNVNHTTLLDAQNSLNSWAGLNPFHIAAAKNKMSMGIPFYGVSADRTSKLAYKLDPNFASVFGTGSTPTGSYYYNSSMMVEAKMHYMMDNGFAGIFIPDLTDDRVDAYSFQSFICKDISVGTPIPSFNVVASVNCNSTNNTQLDVNLPVAIGRTFSWYRNGTLLGTTTAPTYNCTSPVGYNAYKAVVNQVDYQNNWSRENTCNALVGSSIQTAPASSCGAGNALLSAISVAGGIYEWYRQPIDGFSIGKGNQLSAYVSAPTLFYVQDSKIETYHIGQQLQYYYDVQVEGSIANGHLPGNAQLLSVQKNLRLKSVTVNSLTSSSNATIVLVSATDGSTVLQESAPFNTGSNSTTVVPVNFTLAAGSYYIGIYMPSPAILYSPSSLTTEGFTIPGIITLDKKGYATLNNKISSTVTSLPQLYDFAVECSAPICTRQPVAVAINPVPAPVTGFTGAVHACVNSTETYQVDPVAGVKYKWNFSGGPCSVKDNTSGVSNTANAIYSNNIAATYLSAAGSGYWTVTPTNGVCLGQPYTSTVMTITGLNADSIVGTSIYTPGGYGIDYTVVPKAGQPVYNEDYNWIYTGTGILINKHDARHATIYFLSGATPGNLYAESATTCGTSRTNVLTMKSISAQRSSGEEVQTAEAEVMTVDSYPNPYENNATLEITIPQAAAVTVRLTQTTSNAEYTLLDAKWLQAGVYQFDYPSQLPSGIYILQVSDGNNVKTEKVIKL